MQKDYLLMHILSKSRSKIILHMNIFSFQIKNAIVADLKSKGLQANQHSIKKTMQLYETKSSRHSVVIVGGTQSGKTVAWKTLQGALISLFRKGDYDFNNVKVCVKCNSRACFTSAKCNVPYGIRSRVLSRCKPPLYQLT